jgi:Outer membrane protein beta-barrel domain
MRGHILLPVTTLLLGSTAWSQENLSIEGPYFGASIGAFDYSHNLGGFFRFSDTASIGSIYGGYRFNDRWAVEGSYGNTSTLTGRPFGIPLSADFAFMEVRGLAHFGNLYTGVGYWNSDVSRSGFSLGAPELRDDSDVSLLLGGEWSFRRDWTFRLEYELFDTRTLGMTDESTVNSSRLSFGAHYRFGRH